jgi:hypothetical protein
LRQQIEAEIGTPACASAAQCHTIAIGRKACGGPESYLAWSSTTSDGATLARLAEAYAAERERDNVASGMASNCMLVTDPGATCSAGRCVLQKGGLGGSDAR